MTRLSGMTPARRAGFVGVLAVILLGVFTSGYFVVAALAAPSMPAPVISSSPTNPATSSSATFRFTDSQARVTFMCSLDSASFAACVSGIAYSGLAEGSHTFRVEAVSGSKTSTAASYSWAVVPPAPVIVTHPANPANTGTASFTYTDSQSGVSFKCSLDGSSFSACPSAGQSYSGLSNGSHTFAVEAQKGNGPPSASASYTWRVNAGPAAPVITSGPTNPSTNTSPEFIFTDTSWPDVTFTCWLDSGKHMGCTGDTDHDGNRNVEGEWQFSSLAQGAHCFSVYATDGGRRQSPTTEFCWTIGTGGQNFAVGGDLTSPLYPGTSLPLDMTFTNPNSSPITIPSGANSASNITITSNANGCASSNFTVAQSLTVAITIPANQVTVISLSALGVPQADWPVIKMINTNTNQDACEGAKLTLTYSGIEATG